MQYWLPFFLCFPVHPYLFIVILLTFGNSPLGKISECSSIPRPPGRKFGCKYSAHLPPPQASWEEHCNPFHIAKKKQTNKQTKQKQNSNNGNKRCLLILLMYHSLILGTAEFTLAIHFHAEVTILFIDSDSMLQFLILRKNWSCTYSNINICACVH